MAASRLKLAIGYGLNDGSGSRGGRTFLAPLPYALQSNPTTNIPGIPGQTAVNLVTGASFIFSGTNGWVALTTGGSAGTFTTLTVSPGPISLTGTTTVNTSGAAVTTIGTGGTGAVLIGNTTGNTAVTGTLTSSGNITATAGGLTATAGNITATNGNLVVSTAGNKLSIATGANASVGKSAAMVAGTITIATTAVTANSIILLTHASVAGTIGTLSVGTIVAGTSFVINSSSNTDTSLVNWLIIN